MATSGREERRHDLRPRERAPGSPSCTRSPSSPPGQTPPPPGSDLSLFEPTPPKEPYDGTTLVNSGLLPQGPTPASPFQVTFDTLGTYRYHCVIHPLMTGTVTVAEQAGDADPQSQITARGDAEVSRWLVEGEGRAAKKRLIEMPAKRTKNSDGTTSWRVEMGTSTEHTDVLAFAPLATQIKPADSVVFVNNDSGAPHTATLPAASACRPTRKGCSPPTRSPPA
jgi:plastocyanin